MHIFQPVSEFLSITSHHHPRKKKKKKVNAQIHTLSELILVLKTQTETLEIEKNLTKKNKNRPIEDYFQKTATHRRNQSKMPN